MNTDTLQDAIIRHLKQKAQEFNLEDFSNWFIQELILKKGNRKTGMGIHKILDCKNDLTVIYNKLKS